YLREQTSLTVDDHGSAVPPLKGQIEEIAVIDVGLASNQRPPIISLCLVTHSIVAPDPIRGPTNGSNGMALLHTFVYRPMYRVNSGGETESMIRLPRQSAFRYGSRSPCSGSFAAC